MRTGLRRFDARNNRFVALSVRNVARQYTPLGPRRTLDTSPPGRPDSSVSIGSPIHPKEQYVMGSKTVSRRTVLKAGPCALAGAVAIPKIASARAQAGLNPRSDEIIRRWYAAWEKK